MKFHFTAGDQWWHASPQRRHTYRHCHMNPEEPRAEPRP